MSPQKIEELPLSESPGRPLVRAICHFEDGQVSRLLVTDLSRQGAFICSLRPPPMSTAVSLTLRVGTEAPISGMTASVIDVRLDPANAERNGFWIRFDPMLRLQRERLQNLVDYLNDQPRPAQSSGPPSVPERRQQARVDVDFRAEVTLPVGLKTFKMLNLSMSGALLVLREEQLPPGLHSGARTEVLVYAPSIPEALNLQCEVVRCMSRGGSPEVAVRFRGMDDDQAALLESLMLYALIQKGFPTYPYAGSGSPS